MAKCFEKHKDLGEAELCASNMTYPSTLLRKALKSRVDPCMVQFIALNIRKTIATATSVVKIKERVKNALTSARLRLMSV